MMRPAFSEQVSSPGWRASAERWIVDRVTDRGWTVDGEITQPRIRPWSTQLVVPSSGGTLWFKANAPAFAFEPALQDVLADIVPESIQEPFATDPHHAWMITTDHGASMADEDAATTADWIQIVVEAARVQQALLPHRSRLLATGLPDRSPERVVPLFDELRERLRAWPAPHPGNLAPADDALLEEARPLLAAAAQRIATGPIPDAWNHGDLHAQNVYRDGERLRMFDLGDGSWASALEILAVPWEWLAESGTGADVEWDHVLAAYLGQWEWDVDVADTWRDIRLLHAVNRSQVWAAWLDDTTPAEAERYGRAAKEHLTSVLDVLEMREAPGSS